MERMKFFFKLLVVFVVFYIFVEFMSYAYIKSSYRNISCDIENSTSKIQIKEAKTTNINGYIKGSITNNKEQKIEYIYIIVDCISSYGNILETRYIKIENLNPGETREFKVNYECNKANNLKIYTNNKILDTYKTSENKDITRFSVIASVLILLYYLH